MAKLNAVTIGILSFCAVPFILSATPVFRNGYSDVTLELSNVDLSLDREDPPFQDIGYHIYRDAHITFTGRNNITTNAADSIGFLVSGNNTTLNLESFDFDLEGLNSAALRAEGGATVTLGSDTTILLLRGNNIGVIIDNAVTDPVTGELTGETATATVISSTNIGDDGPEAIGYLVQNGARLILMPDSTLQLDNSNTTGIRIVNGGDIQNNSSMTIADGVGIDVLNGGIANVRGGTINVSGDSANTAGIRVGENTQLVLGRSDAAPEPTNAVINASGNAQGILVNGPNAALSVFDTNINISGTGNGVDNRSETNTLSLNNVGIINEGSGAGIRSASSLDTGDATITVSGVGSGIKFNDVGADGTDITADRDFSLGSGYLINVSSAEGRGIVADTAGTVSSAARVNINNTAGKAAFSSVAVTGFVNSGELRSQSLSSPVVDLSDDSADIQVANTGTIAAADALHTAIATGSGNDVVSLTGGAVVGDVSTGDGDDTINWTGGSLDGSLTLGAGNSTAFIRNVDLSNTRHITSEEGNENNTLTFSQINGRGGSFSDDDPAKGVNLGAGWNTINLAGSQWTLTDNLQLAGSEVNIDGSSTLYAGDNVHPVINGTVNNSGTLDLTNGSGSPGNTLVINGDLNSAAGIARLMTRLNEGGPLTNQATDNLQVLGNATGTTFLDIRAASGSTGSVTDTNNNGIADSTEGISVAQVAGTAGADSFALLGGYAAAGPWRYDLYSFAPGSSDAAQRRVAGGTDNQYWDYRLESTTINEDGSTGGTGGRLAVIPQVPSYITAPVGLAYYTSAIVDDLHKRLGELRQQKAYDNGVGGEMFVRYVGSTLEHKSDLSFKNFGYNLDIDYNALQIGGNVVKLDGANDSLRGGLAYTRGRTELKPHAVDGFSRTVFNSDSLALYSTWLRDSGFYVDGALGYDWHRGETDVSHQKKVGRLKAHGWSASVETGYPFLLQNDVRLEPQAQLTYMRLNLDDFTDQDGARVQYGSYNQTVGRVGVRVDRSWSDGRGHLFTPWLRTNYYHGWGGNAKTTVSAENGGASHAFDGGSFGQMWEVGAGATVNVKHDLAFYAEADYRREVGDSGAKGWRYNAGVRWQF